MKVPYRGRVGINADDGIKLFFCALMDNKPVHLLSTVRSTLYSVSRTVYNKVTGAWRTQNFQFPSIIKWYNKGMGGTDLFDQFLSYYRPKVKTVAWPVRIFTHFISAAVANAFIIYKDVIQPPSSYTLLDLQKNSFNY